MQRKTMTLTLLGLVLLACDLSWLAPSPTPRSVASRPPSESESSATPIVATSTATPTLVVATALPTLTALPTATDLPSALATPIAAVTATPSARFAFTPVTTIPIESSLASSFSRYWGGVKGQFVPVGIEADNFGFHLSAKVLITAEKTGPGTFPPTGPLDHLKFVIGQPGSALEFSAESFGGFFANQRVVVGKEQEGWFQFIGILPPEKLADPSQPIVLKARWIVGGQWRLR